MKIFNTKDIREIDAYTISNEPIASIDLMERAARGCAEWISSHLKKDSVFRVFTGPGNNGGDGWAIARLLADKGYQVELYHLNISEILSADSEINRKRLLQQAKVKVNYIEKNEDFPLIRENDMVIDALFGSGLTRPLEGLPLKVISFINQCGCRTISIDIPSGLLGEDNTGNNEDGIIRADFTLTFQFPKRSFFFAENEKYTGDWMIVPIGLHPDVIRSKHSDYFYSDAELIRPLIKKRKKFAHKGVYGHGLLIAGSYGMMGAAILAARSCLRTGAGLLTTHVPGQGYPVIQSAVPESIFSIDPDENIFSQCPPTGKFNAIAAGPGIGTLEPTSSALQNLIRNNRMPLVLDADALNILAATKESMEILPAETILTPHPGEFDRLAGSSSNGYQRNCKQIELSKKYGLIIVLKGAYTSVTMPDGKCYYNSTGNPGMATAGSGDVLTGMILSLLAQGYRPEHAALSGVYIHGLAGDLASVRLSQEALMASDIIENIGNAFNKILRNETSDI